MNVEAVWSQIKAHAGETFYTKTGKPFTYHVRNRIVVLENTERNIPIGDFEKAMMVVNPTVGEFQRLNLQGPAYLYGIITDPRITQ